jgi:hypothetical protein
MNYIESIEPGGYGSLAVRVTTSGGALALPNAMITITDPAGDVLDVLYTDRSGLTRDIPLPARLPQEDGEGNITARSYTVEIDYPGFQSIVRYNIPIFPGIRSLQLAYMLPLVSYEGSPIIGDEARHESYEEDADALWGGNPEFSGAEVDENKI